jgi:hypothetical protein
MTYSNPKSFVKLATSLFILFTLAFYSPSGIAARGRLGGSFKKIIFTNQIGLLYQIIITKSIQKELDNLPNLIKERVFEKISQLAEVPRPD